MRTMPEIEVGVILSRSEILISPSGWVGQCARSVAATLFVVMLLTLEINLICTTEWKNYDTIDQLCLVSIGSDCNGIVRSSDPGKF